LKTCWKKNGPSFIKPSFFTSVAKLSESKLRRYDNCQVALLNILSTAACAPVKAATTTPNSLIEESLMIKFQQWKALQSKGAA